MKKAGSFEDITAIFLCGALAMLTVLALSLTVSSSQTSRDEKRAAAIKEHRTTFDTRTVLQTEIQSNYSLSSFLADAATTGRIEEATQILKDELNKTGAEWYWFYAGREGTLPQGKDVPDIQAEPIVIPTQRGTINVLLYRYDE